jgi:hypothetical protein
VVHTPVWYRLSVSPSVQPRHEQIITCGTCSQLLTGEKGVASVEKVNRNVLLVTGGAGAIFVQSWLPMWNKHRQTQTSPCNLFCWAGLPTMSHQEQCTYPAPSSWLLNSILHQQEPEQLGEKEDSRTEPGMYRVSLEPLTIPKSKEALNTGSPWRGDETLKRIMRPQSFPSFHFPANEGKGFALPWAPSMMCCPDTDLRTSDYVLECLKPWAKSPSLHKFIISVICDSDRKLTDHTMQTYLILLSELHVKIAKMIAFFLEEGIAALGMEPPLKWCIFPH